VVMVKEDADADAEADALAFLEGAAAAPGLFELFRSPSALRFLVVAFLEGDGAPLEGAGGILLDNDSGAAV
jgi:hypothetical protein